MKKATSKLISEEDDMLPEYDFSDGIRGKHYKERQAGYTVTIHKTDGTTEVKSYGPKNPIVLAPDVQEYFPTAQAVNHALRSLIALFPNQKRNAQRTTLGIKNGRRSKPSVLARSRIKSKSINSR